MTLRCWNPYLAGKTLSVVCVPRTDETVGNGVRLVFSYRGDDVSIASADQPVQAAARIAADLRIAP
jgi:hypothetical protein